jgi:hypothetical protein
LDELAEDSRQTAGVRLQRDGLYRGGEKLKVKPLMAIAEGDKIRAAAWSTWRIREAGNDRRWGRCWSSSWTKNSEVRTAAICALRGSLPPQAVLKLKEAMDSLDPPQAMLFIFDVLGEYKNRDACDALASFLSSSRGRQKAKIFLRPPRLETACGKVGGRAGEDQYRAGPRGDQVVEGGGAAAERITTLPNRCFAEYNSGR